MMKLHSFGRLTADQPTITAELQAIGLVEATNYATGKALWAYYLTTAFPQVQISSGITAKLANLLASEIQTVSDFLSSVEPLDQTIFYHVALQLL